MHSYPSLDAARAPGRVWLLLAASATLSACLQEPPPDLTPHDSGPRGDASTSAHDAGPASSLGVDAAGRDR
jgi:hypothetical protein